MKEKNIPNSEAYWINPHGKILAVAISHVDEIIKKPEAFGFTISQIQALYDKENERLGVEGKAREKMILKLIKTGWIRIRNYIKKGRWTINVPDLSDTTKDRLHYFAFSMLENGESKYDSVKIDLPAKILTFTMEELASDVLYGIENSHPPHKRDILEAVEELPDTPDNIVM